MTGSVTELVVVDAKAVAVTMAVIVGESSFSSVEAAETSSRRRVDTKVGRDRVLCVKLHQMGYSYRRCRGAVSERQSKPLARVERLNVTISPDCDKS